MDKYRENRRQVLLSKIAQAERLAEETDDWLAESRVRSLREELAELEGDRGPRAQDKQ